MEDKKRLNYEELEMVAGGTGEYNPYCAAIETAIQEVEAEVDILNGDSRTPMNSSCGDSGTFLIVSRNIILQTSVR